MPKLPSSPGGHLTSDPCADRGRTAAADGNVIWTSPSADSFDTMPLSGSRGAGANVWFQDGALWLYLGHAAAWDATSELRKLGAMRIRPADIELRDLDLFSQELDLPTGSIRVVAESAHGSVEYRLWFAEDTLVIEGTTSAATRLAIEFGSWRDAPGGTGSGAHVESVGGALVYAHRNGRAIRAADEARAQHIPDDAAPRIAQDRTFGCAIAARGGLDLSEPTPVAWQTWRGIAWPARTVEADTAHRIVVALRAERYADVPRWTSDAMSLLEDTATETARRDARARWRAFWSRSHVSIRAGARDDDPAAQVGRNYQRFRYMTACAAGAEMPLKFNGGIFTTDARPARIPARLDNPEFPMGGTADPDYMRWTANMFMSQNQRWLGWPAIANGDDDLLAPSRAFYRDRLDVARARARNLGADGACYIEPQTPEGLCCYAPDDDGLCGAPWLSHHFSMGLEHAWMTLCGHDVLGYDIRPDLPWMVEQIRFFDSFYRKSLRERTGAEVDHVGRLVLYPCNGLELASEATNPVETVCAIRRVVSGLLGLPVLAAHDRAFLERVEPTLPDIPMTVAGGRDIIAVADDYVELLNGYELPELYAAWPYRFVGTTQPATMELARATWDAQVTRGNKPGPEIYQLGDLSWQPTAVNAAALGMTEQAAAHVQAKMSDAAGCTRFPAFFGPGHDWMPDHNWGGCGIVAVQEMLMASSGDTIFLLPAWPADWDVSFRLHAPGRTTVEAELRDGALVDLRVTPAHRRNDVVIPDWATKVR
jgi:hypothetical protein